MQNFFGNNISNELLLVYGLITVVVIFIVVIITMDRVSSKKKPQNLFDTLNMKIINENGIETKKETKEELPKKEAVEEIKTSKTEVIEIKSTVREDSFEDLEPIKISKKVVDFSEYAVPFPTKVEEEPEEVELLETVNEENDYYVETDLEKTQAQIRVEEIKEALENAQIEERVEEDKYVKFEEEQEKNAIISYNELKASFDKLYSENEKIQYLEDEEIPINIEELYKLTIEKTPEEPEIVDNAKLEDFRIPQPETKIQTSKVVDTNSLQSSTFKSSPFISPVYGIQKPPVSTAASLESDLQNANQFLTGLTELKSNLD